MPSCGRCSSKSLQSSGFVAFGRTWLKRRISNQLHPSSKFTECLSSRDITSASPAAPDPMPGSWGAFSKHCSLMFNLCWGLYIPLNFLPTLLRGASLENSLCKDGSPPVVTFARVQIGWSNFFALSLPVIKQKWACCLMSACLNCVLSNLPMCGYCGEGVADTHFQLLYETLHLGGDPEPASSLFLNVSRLSQKKSLIRSCLWG